MAKQLWLPFEQFPITEAHPRYIKVDGREQGYSKHGLDADEAANLAVRIAVLLRQARFRNAVELIAEAEWEITGHKGLIKTYEPLLESPICASSLPTRLVNMLAVQGFEVWGDVVHLQPQWFVEHIPGWGPKCVEELQRVLRSEIKKRREASKNSLE